MNIAQRVSEEAVGDLLFTDYLLILLNKPKDQLMDVARVALAIVLGNDPDRLTKERGLVDFVDRYIREVFIAYTTRGPALQIPLINIGRQFTVSMVAEHLLMEVEKTKHIAFPVEELADSVFINPERRWNLFVLLVAITALTLQQHKAMWESYGVKKSLFGYWRKT